MKKNAILSSILTLVLCVSLITGATFALFTSESKNNIAVTSGKVEVVASIENLTLYSPELIEADGTYDETVNAASGSNFYNGGSAAIENGVKLVLTNVTPGDKVNFQIKLTNNSNVTVQYRTIVRVLDDNGLASGLKMVIGEDYDGTTKYSNWTIMPTSETTKVLDCSVELPTTAGDEYQEKKCTIAYTVEAIQANAATDNNVAKIISASGDETKFVDFKSAINAVQENETVEILRAGTYEPFTIPVEKENVTVKGIVGKTKAESTVITTTATENICTYGKGTTIDSLWIETPVKQTIGWLQEGAINPYISTDSGIIAENITVTNCHIDGCNTLEFAIMFCSSGLTFTNNTVENFSEAVRVMDDGGTADNFVISGNTFKNVPNPINAYWGASATAETGAVVITNNTVEGDEAACFGLWDYAQLQYGKTAFSNIEISGNKGNILYSLTHFNWKVATPCTLNVGAGTQEVRYLSMIASDIPKANSGNYEIAMADGSEWDKSYGHNTFTKVLNNNAAIYTLASGDYFLVDKTTGVKTPFTVTDPVVGRQQSVKLPIVETIGTAADLKALFDDAFKNGNTDSVVVILSNDIDVKNEWSSFDIPNMSASITIDGAGHTITNLNTPLVTALWGGYGSLIYKDLTIANSKVFGYDTAIDVGGSVSASGAFLGYFDAGTNIVFENCHLSNSTVSGDADYTGGFVGYASSPVTFKNCTVTGSTVSGLKSTGALIGHVGADDLVISKCTITGNTLRGQRDNETDVGEVFGRTSGGDTVTMTELKYENNTIIKAYGTENEATASSKIFGSLNGYTATLDGNPVV